MGTTLRIVGNVDAQTILMIGQAGVKIELYHHVDDATLTAFYRDCLALISPSLSEGLNLPVGEALAFGTEVICSDIPVHREFYDGFVHFFDPKSTDSLTAVIDALAQSAPKFALSWQKGIRRGFADVASEYFTIFNSVGEKLRLGQRN